MQSMEIGSIVIYYQEIDRQSAELVGQACEKTTNLLRDAWHLATPPDCRVYLMTSWLDFSFRAPPWPWKIYSALTLPLWAGRVRQTWQLAGGWAQAYGLRRAIGVKPPRLISQTGGGLLGRIFVEETPEEMIQRITCHELTHAFSETLRLPSWLHEGLAMLAQDRYFGRQTVRQESLKALEQAPKKERPPVALPADDPDDIVYIYTRSYWLTRYLAEKLPDTLLALLETPLESSELETRIAQALGQPTETFWQEIDALLVKTMENPG